MSRPKDADSAETWTRIIEAARAILDEQTDESTLTLRAVAERADVSLGTLAYYFPTKAALLEACLDRYYELLGTIATDLIARAGSKEPAELITEAAKTIYRFHREQRTVLAIRVRTRLLRGALPVERQERVLGPLVGLGAAALARMTGRSEDEMRFGIQSMTYLITHFALSSPEEMAKVFGRPVDQEIIEDHLAQVAVRLFT